MRPLSLLARFRTCHRHVPRSDDRRRWAPGSGRGLYGSSRGPLVSVIRSGDASRPSPGWCGGAVVRRLRNRRVPSTRDPKRSSPSGVQRQRTGSTSSLKTLALKGQLCSIPSQGARISGSPRRRASEMPQRCHRSARARTSSTLRVSLRQRAPYSSRR